MSAPPYRTSAPPYRTSATHFACSPFVLVWISMFVGHGLLCRGIAGETVGTEDRECHALIAARCLECHRGDEAAGGLNLSARSGLEQGGDSGEVFHLANRRKSLLWRVIASGEMPPKTKLDDSEKALLIGWMERGAPLPDEPIDPLSLSSKYRAGLDWWALAPLQHSPSIPPSSDPAMRNPIDGWVVRQHQAHDLAPNPEASRRVWLRRVHFDLLGLPPTFEEVLAFESDASEVAYEAVVDRLLASPAYGERWARHWLDVVRFGESDGFERNFSRANAWPYRDWVIRALNNDMPYDTFVSMQIAGDQLDPSPDGLAATGFLVCGLHNTVVGQSERMKRIAKHDELEDKVGTLAQTFLGLTAQCARCHEHKYDPISSRSYYQLASALQGIQHGDREWAGDQGKIYAVSSDPHPGPMHILQRGDVFQSGASVRAGGIVGLGDQADFGLTDSAGDGERRVALAAWITTANRALLARVLVNRVWHYHFGCGIVETPNDFGFNGARPSHPELLDELASRWIADGMHWKSLHRTIVLSRTYRSSSRPDPRSLEIDRNNRWLWRYPVRRLEGEAVRDSMLAISGLLRSPMGGPGFQDVEIRENNGTTYYHPKHQETPDCYRRTVYRFSPRCERNPILDGLDCPDPSAAAPRRATTTTPLQALSLLNNPFVFTSADALVERIAHRDRDARPESHEAWVQALFHLVLLRDAEEGELRDAVELVRAHGPSALARSLWNTNEFLVLE